METQINNGNKRTKRALVIGINYTSRIGLQLYGCIIDARRTVTLLKSRGFKTSQIRVLTDHPGANREQLPTLANIRAGFEWLVQPSTEPLDLYLHYSGHGDQMMDLNGDEIDGMDEMIVPLDVVIRDRSTWISDDEIRSSIVDKLRSGDRLWAVMDSCHSGTVLDLPFSLNDGITMKVMGAKLHTDAEVVCLSGAIDSQLAADSSYGSQASGAMTTAYLRNYRTGMNHLALLDAIRKDIVSMGINFQVPTLSYGQYQLPNQRLTWI